MLAENTDRYLITGGAGFIGANFIHYLAAKEPDAQILNIDKLTYAGNTDSLEPLSNNANYQFLRADICDGPLMKKTIFQFNPTRVVHFAAESHVDRSIDEADAFIQTNIVGTHQLLKQSRAYWEKSTNSIKERFRFLHVSTDEVYGSVEEGLFSEKTAYAPNSPYSASKASSDHLARAWFHTYKFPILITNCSNNYGPYQFPEKLIPVVILNAINNKPIPIYGDGENIRDWLYVTDHCKGIYSVIQNGKAGETYNIGGDNQLTNLKLAQTICELLDKLRPKNSGSYLDQIKFVEDRPGHDRRYAVDCEKIKRELGWKAEENFESGIMKTILWYLENTEWIDNIISGGYKLNRIGLPQS